MEIEAIELSELPERELRTMLAAGEKVTECVRVLGNTGDNIVGELLHDAETFYEWNHYPEGDVFDPHSNAQYYYHAHPRDQRPGEHGHFHTFLRPQGMPPGIEPAPLPDFEPPDGENDALSHLIAVSCDKKGQPIKLFTTNRWVTGEVWYAASDVCRMLNYFVIDHVRPSWAVNLWLSNLLVLFRPQIRALIEGRDEAIAAWEAKNPGVNVYEDRDLEVTTELSISVSDHISAIRDALKRPG
ncbi:MAG: hypothetical protein JSU82_04525 [Rhodospirillales bacterium]|nr:MAG: hypothetical protein JSU82_04525 [Rhodospirillales bacterium]